VKGEAPLAPGATVRFGDVQLVFEPTDDAVPVARGGGTQMLRTPHSVAPPGPSAPLAPPKPAAPAVPRASPPPKFRPPVAKPGSKRPAAQHPAPKKGKGCGGGAAMLLLGAAGLAALLHRLLA